MKKLLLVSLLGLLFTACTQLESTPQNLQAEPYELLTEKLEFALASVQQGDTFPDLSAEDQFGNTISLSDFSDKLLIVHYCALWCVPCQNFTRNLGDLRSILDQELGVDRYEIVEVLLQDSTFQDSDASSAALWAEAIIGDASTSVLHMSGGANQAPLQALSSLGISSLGIPAFVVLGPGLQFADFLEGIAGDPAVDAVRFLNALEPFLKTPQELINELITQISTADIQPNGVKHAFLVKLKDALASTDAEHAVRKLQAFIHQVNAQKGKKVAANLANSWIDIAQESIDLLR